MKLLYILEPCVYRTNDMKHAQETRMVEERLSGLLSHLQEKEYISNPTIIASNLVGFPLNEPSSSDIYRIDRKMEDLEGLLAYKDLFPDPWPGQTETLQEIRNEPRKLMSGRITEIDPQSVRSQQWSVFSFCHATLKSSGTDFFRNGYTVNWTMELDKLCFPGGIKGQQYAPIYIAAEKALGDSSYWLGRAEIKDPSAVDMLSKYLIVNKIENPAI